MDFDLIKNQLKQIFLDIGIPEKDILEITDDEILETCNIVHAHIVNPDDYVKRVICAENHLKLQINLRLNQINLFLLSERVKNHLYRFTLYYFKRLYWRSLIRSPTI